MHLVSRRAKCFQILQISFETLSWLKVSVLISIESPLGVHIDLHRAKTLEEASGVSKTGITVQHCD